MSKFLIPLVGLLLTVLISPEATYAHAFGKLYNLPVPFWLYLYAGVAAVVISFLVIGYFFNKQSFSSNKHSFSTSKTESSPTYKSKDLSGIGLFRFLTSDLILAILKVIGASLFLLAIISGFIGENNSLFNFNMTFFWVIFTLGFTYMVAIFGNIWIVFNPWRNIVELAEKFLERKFSGIVTYPKFLGYWPSFLFYFLFIWIELLAATNPLSLSVTISIYTVITFAGVIFFGKNIWFEYGEFFSVFFRTLGKIASFEYRNKKIFLRPPLIGLLKDKAEHFSLVVFIVFMLSSTAFDGFKSTTPWVSFSKFLIEPWVGALFGGNTFLTYQIVNTLGLIGTLLFFLYFYLIFTMLAKVIAKSPIKFGQLVLNFAYALVPIALVYNVAHYYTLIQTEGQNIFRLISDPFGFGWNLFGTGGYETNYSVINANFAWHSQVALILIGHIVGVYLSHLVALRVFLGRKALASQIPMLVLMVLYTIAGLWILAQPIASEI